MRRGFKSESEERAQHARAALGLSELDRLCPFEYAKHLGIPVVFPKDIKLPQEDFCQLTVTDPDSWSGLTMKKGESAFIVLNSAHPRTRQVSTLMHEISHLSLRHVPARIDVSDNGLLLLSEYDSEQEEEADWLGATLLLPRALLLAARIRGETVEAIAKANGVSTVLCNWRLRKTAVDVQLRARRR